MSEENGETVVARLRAHPTYSKVSSTLCLLLAASWLLTASVVADAAVYEGHIKGLPETRFDLTVGTKAGKRVVKRLDYDDVPFTCENGPGAHNGFNRYSSGNRVRRGAFDVRTVDPGFFTHLVGKLKRGGGAAGTYNQRVDLGPPQSTCKTGTLAWVAQRP